MNRINPLLHAARRAGMRIFETLGPGGILGAALLCASLAGALVALHSVRAADQLRVRAVELEEQARSLEASGATRRTANPTERLARFQSWFPSEATIAQDLRRIFHAAAANHVVLVRGEYALTNVEGSPTLSKLDIVLPVHEHYGAVKGFFGAVLNEIPHASLKELRVERPAAGTEELESRVHFTLFYRKAAP
jgi:hypothetical protein